MAKKSKSLFRQPGARKFQLVHRSQRDPLIHDPEASTHVFKPIHTGKGKAKADAPGDNAPVERPDFGEAALYGIYYDDSEYDYMQHLRAVGEKKDGVESIWIEAPVPTKKEKVFLREDMDDEYGDLPLEARPSKLELTQAQAQKATEAIPAELTGLQPDMDPHLRQALEALEDEAFVVAEVRGLPRNFDPKGAKAKAKEDSVVVENADGEDDAEGDDILDDADDFFADLVKDGEREEDEEAPWDFQEEGFEDAEEGSSDVEEDGNDVIRDGEDWQDRFKRFQLARKAGNEDDTDSEDEFDGTRSEAQDTVGQLPRLPVIGGKRRRKGTSDASGYSMSSSSMFRNNGLTMLDERFDQIEKDYLSDSEEEDDDDDDDAPELLNSSEHFNSIMDDFLDNYEILGGKMLPVMPGETPAEKLGTLRQTLKEQGVPIRIGNVDDEDEDEEDEVVREDIDEANKWDCETILSTYSNLENHPKIVRAAKTRNVTKIVLDSRTGLPSVASEGKRKKSPALEKIREEADPEQPRRVTVARVKDESKEEKKARKQAVKEERQARRSTKKATQMEFANERKQQLRLQMDAPAKGVRRL